MKHESKKFDNISYLMLLLDLQNWLNLSSYDPEFCIQRLRDGLEMIEQASTLLADVLARETGTRCQIDIYSYSVVGIPNNDTMRVGFIVCPINEEDKQLMSPELRDWRDLTKDDFGSLQPLIVELLAIWVLQLRAQCEREGSLTVPTWPKRE